MSAKRNGIDASELSWGLILITAGVLFMLDRLGVAEFHHVIRNYWPLFIVMMGVSKLFNPRTVWNGLWLAAIGIWLQMVTLHLFDLTYRSSWPLLLIAAGVCVTLRALFGVVRRPVENGSPEESQPMPQEGSQPNREERHE